MPKKSIIPNKIISFLQKNPSASRDEIGKGIGVSYQAVQKHLQIFEKERKILPGFIVCHNVLKNNFKFWIMIGTLYSEKLTTNDVYGKDYQRRLCNEIVTELLKNDKWSKDIIFNQIDIVLAADWDIILCIYSENADTVANFVTEYLRTHTAISRTSTAWSPSADVGLQIRSK